MAEGDPSIHVGQREELAVRFLTHRWLRCNILAHVLARALSCYSYKTTETPAVLGVIEPIHTQVELRVFVSFDVPSQKFQSFVKIRMFK
jgi:hypothetical protein